MEKSPGPGPGPHAPIPSTTFIQTDATAFKELVQRLTGPTDDSLAHAPQSSAMPMPPAPKVAGVKRPTFKLHERRQGSRSKLTIMKPNSSLIPLMGFSSPSPSSPGNHVFSPLISPSNDLSGLRLSDKESKSKPSLHLDEAAEEMAIKERQFYLHPSPRGLRPRNPEPELLPLFPLTSPNSVKP